MYSVLYPDSKFFEYRSGIYERIGANVGSHVVRVLGWGTTSGGDKYWICANSWGTGWGEDGFFKIKFGAADFGIKAGACKPKTLTSDSGASSITFSLMLLILTIWTSF
jgi:C1A family cysteine protease